MSMRGLSDAMWRAVLRGAMEDYAEDVPTVQSKPEPIDVGELRVIEPQSELEQ